MSGFQLASVGALPFPLTLTLNEIFHNLNRPGLPGGAFRSARKAEIGLEADFRRAQHEGSLRRFQYYFAPFSPEENAPNIAEGHTQDQPLSYDKNPRQNLCGFGRFLSLLGMIC